MLQHVVVLFSLPSRMFPDDQLIRRRHSETVECAVVSTNGQVCVCWGWGVGWEHVMTCRLFHDLPSCCLVLSILSRHTIIGQTLYFTAPRDKGNNISLRHALCSCRPSDRQLASYCVTFIVSQVEDSPFKKILFFLARCRIWYINFLSPSHICQCLSAVCIRAIST